MSDPIITTRHALALQVIDDAPHPVRSKQIVRIASKHMEIAKATVRTLLDQGLVKWVPVSADTQGGYTLTDKGARELLRFERTVKKFLDYNTYEDIEDEK